MTEPLAMTNPCSSLGEDILDGYLERVVHEGATPMYILHDLIFAAVLAGDGVLARYMPHDVVGEHIGE
jgi:hypothetical protein